ncbi:putative auxin response factor domain-containing protein [Helianthus annuus]|nr:putative auxin response factor domain-containing protein [Helianthus annuus]KAJ0956598.1 putative auxin response factor [Helianthus annuus]
MEMLKVVRPFCSGEQCKGRWCCSDFVVVLVFSASLLTTVLKDLVHEEANLNDLTTILYIKRYKSRSVSLPVGGFENIVKVSVELVVDAANLASTSRPFEVVYHPRASTFEFYVKTSTVKATMRIQWSPKMRLKMASETKVSPQISWFMCTISLDDVKGQYRWSNSPWRLLEVAWDEPDLLQNVKWVRPWLVELVLYVPLIHILPSSPPS